MISIEKRIEERKQANAELIEKIRRLQAKQIETMGQYAFHESLKRQFKKFELRLTPIDPLIFTIRKC